MAVTKYGPKGLLGIPPRRFRERNGPTTGVTLNNLRVTQSGLEPWVKFTPNLFVTQSGIEPWVTFPTTLFVTQVGLEVWIPVNKTATIAVGPRAKLGPKGFLGVPPARFKERTNPTLTDVPPPPPLITALVIPKDKIGPRGLLGVPVRRFREARKDWPTIAPPPPPSGVPKTWFWAVT